jgi:prolyl-tRNA editing enzyme YbaK/EbsC (Cys-tRNA(Pro) deacylase)
MKSKICVSTDKMNSPLTPDDLQAFMVREKIPGEILILEVPTPTVETAAQAVGVSPHQIVKSVLFTVRQEAVLTISCGDLLVERRVIAALYGLGRKRVKLASPEVVLDLTGYAVGTVPPFGHRQHIRTLIDSQVLDLAEIYAGGGAHNALVRLHPENILQTTSAEILDLHTRPA